MNFQLAPIGHSFKGSMAYYLHDKKQEQDAAHPDTAARVAWTESRNLSVADPELATGVMIATARQADELKAAAGVKATGRKSTAGPVFAFSLGWHPSEAEGLDKAEMLRAADHALQVLKLGDRQAVIVAHRDTAHPHVHVIVNRVCPQTGKSAVIAKPDVLKLDKWANDYEQARGKIVSPNRAAKYDEIERKRRQHPDADKRRQHVAEQERKRNAEPKSRAAMLKEFGDQQKADHKAQWRDIAAVNKAKRDSIYADASAAIKEAAARHKAECKPIWAAYFREARGAERSFASREQSVAGVLKNAMDATTHQKVSGQLGNRGTLSATFGNVLSSQARARAFAERQDMTRQQMAARLKSVLDAEIHSIKEKRARDLVGQRVAFDQARAALIEKQDAERAKIREAWKLIYAEREQRGRKPYEQKQATPAPIERKTRPHRGINADAYRERHQRPAPRQRAAMDDRATRQNAAPQQEQKPMKDRFDDARLKKAAAPTPTKPAFISQAQPAPSPSGDVPKPAPKRLQTLPDRKPDMPAVKRLADAKRDFAPAATKPAPAVQKDWSASASKPQAQPMKRLPSRSRDRDREPER